MSDCSSETIAANQDDQDTINDAEGVIGFNDLHVCDSHNCASQLDGMDTSMQAHYGIADDSGDLPSTVLFPLLCSCFLAVHED